MDLNKYPFIKGSSSKNLTVIKNDILKIGHTSFQNDDGNLEIVCSVETTNIEEIILRNVLDLYGARIISAEDFIQDDDKIDIVFSTNLPWSEYFNLIEN